MLIVTGIYNLKDLEDPHLQEDPLLMNCAEGLGKELPKEISNIMCTNYMIAKGVDAIAKWEEKRKNLDDPVLKECSIRLVIRLGK